MPRSTVVTGRAPVVPKRLSLVRQTANILDREVARGTWLDWLPSERMLSQSLGISRPTLRHALRILQENGVIEAVKGKGHRIIAGGDPEMDRLNGVTVHLLCSGSPDHLQKSANRWVDELRTLLFQTNTRLLLHFGPQYLQPNPDHALETLTGQHPDGYWVLARSPPAVQEWFQARAIPCVVAGYTHSGINLPSICIDLEAVCRDAVSIFSMKGHREIGFAHRRSDRARDLRSTKGFKTGVRENHVEGHMAWHDGSTDSILAATRKLLDPTPPVTAILVESAFTYATVSTYLMQQGIRIPDDIALISRSHEPFLDSLLPRPSCYRFDSSHLGRLIHAAMVSLVTGQTDCPAGQSLTPAYSPGQSV